MVACPHVKHKGGGALCENPWKIPADLPERTNALHDSAKGSREAAKPPRFLQGVDGLAIENVRNAAHSLTVVVRKGK